MMSRASLPLAVVLALVCSVIAAPIFTITPAVAPLGNLDLGAVTTFQLKASGTVDVIITRVEIRPDANGYTHFKLDNSDDLPIRLFHLQNLMKPLNFRFLPRKLQQVSNVVALTTNDPTTPVTTFTLTATMNPNRGVFDPTDPAQISLKWDFDGDNVFGEVGDAARNGDELGRDAKFVVQLPQYTTTMTLHYKTVRTLTGTESSVQTTSVEIVGYDDPRSTARISHCRESNSFARGNTILLGNPFSPACCSGQNYDNTMMLRAPESRVPIAGTTIMYRDAPYALDLNTDTAIEISAWIQSENIVKAAATNPSLGNGASMSFFFTETKPTKPTSPSNGAGGIQNLPGAVGIVFSWEDLNSIKVRFANSNGYLNTIAETPADTGIRFWDHLRHLVVLRFETAPTNYLEKATSLWIDGKLVGRFNFDLVAQLGAAKQQYSLYGGWAAHQSNQIGQTLSVTFAYDACKNSF